MTRWIRMDVSMPRDPDVAGLADRIGESVPTALGHVAMVWFAAAEHAPSGDISRITGSTIEQWAGWVPKRGKPAGTFGRAFLEIFAVKEKGRTFLVDWRERQGKLIELAERERTRWHKRSSGETPKNGHDPSAESRWESTNYGDGDSAEFAMNAGEVSVATQHNGEHTTPCSPPERGTNSFGDSATAPTPLHDDSAEATPREADRALEDGPHTRRNRTLVPTSDEQRVLDHYRTVHPRRGVHDDKQVRKIRAALKAFSVEQLCQAIDGNRDDTWHAERRKHELTYVLRDHDTIAHFIDVHEQLNTPLVGEGGMLTDAGRRYFGAST